MVSSLETLVKLQLLSTWPTQGQVWGSIIPASELTDGGSAVHRGSPAPRRPTQPSGPLIATPRTLRLLNPVSPPQAQGPHATLGTSAGTSWSPTRNSDFPVKVQAVVSYGYSGNRTSRWWIRASLFLNNVFSNTLNWTEFGLLIQRLPGNSFHCTSVIDCSIIFGLIIIGCSIIIGLIIIKGLLSWWVHIQSLLTD